MNLKQIEQYINKLQIEIAKNEGKKEQMLIQRQELEEEILALEEDSLLSQQGSLILKNFIVERRASATDAIAKIGSSAAKMIYGDDYSLEFHTFEERRKEGSNAGFKMELKARSKFDGDTVATDILDARGGGFSEVSSFALRIAALDWLKYKGPVILDEAWSSMSNDEKLDAVANFLFTYRDTTHRQILFATHDYKVFGEQADNIVQIVKENGIAKAKNITYEEIMNE